MKITGIIEVTEQAYARRHGIDDEEVTCWRPRTKTIVMTVIGIIISSFIIYWFVSSIINGSKENARGSHNRGKITRSITGIINKY